MNVCTWFPGAAQWLPTAPHKSNAKDTFYCTGIVHVANKVPVYEVHFVFLFSLFLLKMTMETHIMVHHQGVKDFRESLCCSFLDAVKC